MNRVYCVLKFRIIFIFFIVLRYLIYARNPIRRTRVLNSVLVGGFCAAAAAATIPLQKKKCITLRGI